MNLLAFLVRPAEMVSWLSLDPLDGDALGFRVLALLATLLAPTLLRRQ